MSKFNGLSKSEVLAKKKLGLVNKQVDAFSKSYSSIILKNLFSLMHITIIPLIITMIYVDLYREGIVFGIFIVVNTAMNSLEEVRIKKRLESLKSQFIQKASVIRDSVEIEVGVNEIVEGDFVVAKEGEPIIVDGKLVDAKYLQLDESALTGESNYVSRKEGDKVLSGSFIVTGECIYIAEKIGDQNYLNKVGNESLTVKKDRSRLEKAGSTFTTVFIFTGILSALINFYFADLGDSSIESRILSVTTLIAMIIPQTLLLLYSLTFVISTVKLGKKGIIIQKKGAIDELAGIDVICIDKTGTITTNEMNLKDAQYINTDKKIGEFIVSIEDKVYGKNNTFNSIFNFYNKTEGSKSEVEDFDQIPFNSKDKFSVFKGKFNDENLMLILGAPSVLMDYVEEEYKDDILKQVDIGENEGNRVVVALVSSSENMESWKNEKYKKIIIFTIEEQLNPNIEAIIKELKSQEIDVKVISGDSMVAVSRIMNKVGLQNEKAVDLSKNELSFDELMKEDFDIFARAKPEDKFEIIKVLKSQGHRVAMVGDGINDVLGMKLAHVGIAMESGAKVTRDTSDIVLLKNDYNKIPEVFYEGDNIVFNLKMTTKLYLARAFIAYIMTLYFAYYKTTVPILPTSTLIFSFLGSTFPSYVIAFSRQKIKNQPKFFSDIFRSAIPTGIIMGVLSIVLYQIRDKSMDEVRVNTYMVLGLLSITFIYTLILIYQSGKIRNVLLLSSAYIFATVAGTFQTYLPLSNIETNKDKLITLGVILIGALALHTAARVQKNYKNDKQLKLASYGLPIIFILAAIFFPFQSYYGVKPITIESYFNIGIVSLVGIILIVLVNTINIKTSHVRQS